MDKMCLPAVVRLSRSFWDDVRNGTEKEKRQFVLKHLVAMTALCRITTLELRNCAMTGPPAMWLAVLAGTAAGVAQCLVHLDLIEMTSVLIKQGGLQGRCGSAPVLSLLTLQCSGTQFTYLPSSAPVLSLLTSTSSKLASKPQRRSWLRSCGRTGGQKMASKLALKPAA